MCILCKDALSIFLDFDCPVRIEAYNLRLQNVEYHTISDVAAYDKPSFDQEDTHTCDQSGYIYPTPGPSPIFPYAMLHE
jgi:hypothetical protein